MRCQRSRRRWRFPLRHSRELCGVRRVSSFGSVAENVGREFRDRRGFVQIAEESKFFSTIHLNARSFFRGSCGSGGGFVFLWGFGGDPNSRRAVLKAAEKSAFAVISTGGYLVQKPNAWLPWRVIQVVAAYFGCDRVCGIFACLSA